MWSYIGIIPKLLSEEEIIQKFKLFENGDLEARNVIITHNLRLVFDIASRFYIDISTIDDYISVGTIGLVKAVNTFDYGKNIKFSTYAARCILNEILMYLRKEKKIHRREISIEDTIILNDGDNRGMTIGDLLSDNNIDVFLEKSDDREVINYIKEAIQLLSEKERLIIAERYINAKNTQCQIGKMLNLIQPQVSRLEKNALIKIRKYVKSKGIDIIGEPKNQMRVKMKKLSNI